MISGYERVGHRRKTGRARGRGRGRKIKGAVLKKVNSPFLKERKIPI